MANISTSKGAILNAQDAFRRAEKLLNSTIAALQTGVDKAREELDSKNIRELMDVIHSATKALKVPVSSLQKGQAALGRMIAALDEYDGGSPAVGGGSPPAGASPAVAAVGDGVRDIIVMSPNYSVDDEMSNAFGEIGGAAGGIIGSICQREAGGAPDASSDAARSLGDMIGRSLGENAQSIVQGLHYLHGSPVPRVLPVCETTEDDIVEV